MAPGTQGSVVRVLDSGIEVLGLGCLDRIAALALAVKCLDRIAALALAVKCLDRIAALALAVKCEGAHLAAQAGSAGGGRGSELRVRS